MTNHSMTPLRMALLVVAQGAAGVAPRAVADERSLGAKWQESVAGAAFLKEGLSRLHGARYEYECIGLGGTVLRCGPHGFTSPPAQWSPATTGHLQHLPYLTYQYWWDEDAHRLTPFDLVGGYGPESDPGRISSFRHRLDVATGQLAVDLGLEVTRRGGEPGTDAFRSRRDLLVTPEGVLVIRVADSDRSAQPFRLRVLSRTHEGWTSSTTGKDGGLVLEARRPRSCTAALAVAVEADVAWADAACSEVGRRDPGGAVVFYVAPASSYEGDRPSERAWARASRARERGHQALRQQTAEWWRRFLGRSAVSLPDEDLVTWYVRSLYYHGVWFGNSEVPPGCFGTNPIGFSGAVCPEYDLTFSQMALLYTRHFGEAEGVADWLARILPRAQRCATEGTSLHKTTVRYSAGAKYGTLVGYDGAVLVPPTEGEGVQAYANFPSANAACMALAYADWTGDPAHLQDALRVLRETTRMSTEDLQWRPDVAGGAYLDRHAAHSLQQSAALYGLRECLRRGVAEPGWEDLADRVYLPTEKYRGRHVIPGGPGSRPYEGYGDAPWLIGLWWYGFLRPDDALVRPTYEMIARSSTGNYVFNRGWLGVYAAKLREGEEAYGWVRSFLQDDVCLFDETCFGEIVWDWEDFKKAPETAAHASLVCNVVQMLLDPDSQTELTLFPAIPEAWRRDGVAFSGLAARGNLVVSGEFARDRVRVTVGNLSDSTATRRLRVRLPDGPPKLPELPRGAAVEGAWAVIPQLVVPAGGRVELVFASEPRPTR